MDDFLLTILKKDMESNLQKKDFLDAIKMLTRLGDYMKKHKIKDKETLKLYADSLEMVFPNG